MSDRFSRTLPVAAAAWLLAACAAVQPPPPATATASVPMPPRSVALSAPVPVCAQPPTSSSQPVPAVPPVSPADAAARRMLAYHEQLRQLSPPELAQEVTRVNAMIAANASQASPALVLELALALAQTRNNGDLSRALAVLDPLVRSTAPELQPWQPLARLLTARLSDQRRVEEALERQSGQLRDAQRNLQLTNEKLEALKAIERSLNARPGGAASPPASAPAQKAR